MVCGNIIINCKKYEKVPTFTFFDFGLSLASEYQKKYFRVRLEIEM